MILPDWIKIKELYDKAEEVISMSKNFYGIMENEKKSEEIIKILDGLLDSHRVYHILSIEEQAIKDAIELLRSK